MTSAVVLVLLAQLVFRIQDPALSESSALVDLGPVTASVNDSGHAPVVYLLDSRTGATRERIHYAQSVVDTEAMAPAGPSAVWVGDIGDNARRRADVAVYRVPLDRGARVEAPVYRLRYPDGPHDAEAMFRGPGGRLYLVTKQLFGAAFYAAPRRLSADRVNPLRRVAAAPAVATDAASFGDRRHVLVRDYGFAHLYRLPSLRRLGSVRLPTQRQGESISIGPRDRIRVGSEGSHAAVLRARLPERLARLVRPARSDPSTAPTAAPTGPTTGPAHDPASGAGGPHSDGPGPWLIGGAVLAGAVLASAVLTGGALIGAALVGRRRRILRR